MTGYTQGFQNNLQNDDAHLGYTKLDETYAPVGWYVPGAKTKYDFHDGGNTDPRGLVEETRDAFDNSSTVAYDDYKLMPVSSQQYLDATNYLETSADYDYRLLQPWMVTDPNGNRSVFGFSALGLLMKSGVIGKDGEDQGDIITETPFDWKPSVQMEYDFLAWYEEQKPVWVKTIQNEQHYQDDNDSPTIAKVEFSDGFGRLLQTRAQAEDVIFGATADDRIFGDSGLPSNQQATNADAEGTERGSTDPLNVVVSGWQVYDNKGRVVEQYEPFFSQGLDDYAPVEESQKGEKLTMYYDPAGRVVRTVNPDESEQRLVVGIPSALDNPDNFNPSPWHHYAYDANDLADITNLANDNVADSHKYTPKSEIVDALGRTIKTTEHEAASDNGDPETFEDVVMKYEYDIRGNLKKVTDALLRVAFDYEYDLANQPLKTTHIDSGVSRATIDATGKPVEGTDAKDARTLATFDGLSRPVHGWAQNNAGDSLRMVAFNRYGEEATNPENNNLIGQLWEQYDEAGKVELSVYDFKGNVLAKTRKVLSAATLKNQADNFTPYLVDWTGLPSILDSLAFETSSECDALNRVTKLTLPENVNQLRKDILPEYNRAGALEKVTYDGGVYVENIAYNAKGQRLLIAYGNDIMTRYAYDSTTFRLLRQRSEKFSKSQNGSTITYAFQSGNNKQDDGFEYDLVGNILKILHRVSDCGIANTTLGSDALDREFEYDPLNRLTSATSRESGTQNQNDYLYADAPAPGSPNANNVQAYARKYHYDKMGNVLQVKQQGSNGFTRKFGYFTEVNTLEKIVDINDLLIEDFTYDPCGNQLTAGASRHYIWTAANRLLVYKNQIGSSDPTIYAQYDYDGAGNRVSKLVRTGNGSPTYTRTIYIDGIFEYQILENGTTYEKNYVHVMDASTGSAQASRMAMVRVGNAFPDDIAESITYHLENQIKSSAARLDENGTVIDREEFYPFGDSSLRTFSKKRYRYTGKEKDSESGLYYYGARYYSAWTCRFISVDALAKKYNQLTPYQNAGNNPINDRDIDGNKGGKTPKGGGGKKGGGKKGKEGKGGDGDKPNKTTENTETHGGGRDQFYKDAAKAMDSGKEGVSIKETQNSDGSGTGSITSEGKTTTYGWDGESNFPKSGQGDVPEVGYDEASGGSSSLPKDNIDPMPTKPAPDVRNKPNEPSIHNSNLSTPLPKEQQKSGLWAKVGGLLSTIKSFTLSKAESLILSSTSKLSKDSLKLLKGISKFGKGFGIFGIFFGVADAGIDIYKNGWNWRDVTKAGVGISLGVAALFAGPALAAGLALGGIVYGVLDLTGKLDEGLDYMENKYGDDIENKWNEGKDWLKKQEKMLTPQGR